MQKFVFKVDGMMCPMCEAHTNDAVRAIYPKAKVTSSHKAGETTVIGEGIDPTRVKETVEKTGYKVTDFTEEPYEKGGFFSKLFKRK